MKMKRILLVAALGAIAAISLPAGAQDVTLVDARYCGATKGGHGRLVGALRPTPSGESKKQNSISTWTAQFRSSSPGNS